MYSYLDIGKVIKYLVIFKHSRVSLAAWVTNFHPEHSFYIDITQSAFTCWKLTIETLEEGVKYVQS